MNELTACTTDNLNTHDRDECARVCGLVQGVGFRPTVWRIARDLGLTGNVINDGEGVQIQLQGDRVTRDLFFQQLTDECPPLARIDRIKRHAIVLESLQSFDIELSQNSETRTGLVADSATCQDCIDEALAHEQPNENRRAGYAFGNCTHCGPRLSITAKLPYDRHNTSMVAFTLCPDCRAEYQDPADRRFHAQPTACPSCGPTLWLETGDTQHTDDALQKTAQMLLQGKIVALKSTGGFQLACDANNVDSIAELRRRKQRPSKPFALMAASVQQLELYCHVSDKERTALSSAAAPIVLLQRRASCKLPETLAPDLQTLGFMLAHTPLHHLLLRAVQGPLLMTSGNRSGETQCIDNQQAHDQLASIADGTLYHNRDILQRLDDSVMREIDGEMRLMRRARGYAPLSLPVPPGFEQAAPVLAVGAELKNSFCLLQHGQLIQSQYLGDLQNLSAYQSLQQTIMQYCLLFDHSIHTVATDLHPAYLSSQWAQENSPQLQLVQHHHAHIASCLGENAYPLNGKMVLGIALDGSGMGDDGTLWGGELLLCNYRQYDRLACLQAGALPGAEQAIRQPWRNLLARLAHFPAHELAQIDCLKDKPLAPLLNMIATQKNSPLSSSSGRLFDAAAALLGLCHGSLDHEAQAATALEQLAAAAQDESHPGYPLPLNSEHELPQLEPRGLLEAMHTDLIQQVPLAQIARRFHLGVATGLCAAATTLQQQHHFHTVALSGGVCQNRVLIEFLNERLREAGFRVLQHRQVPCNDGGLSLGQALIAAAITLNKPEDNKPCA